MVILSHLGPISEHDLHGSVSTAVILNKIYKTSYGQVIKKENIQNVWTYNNALQY